MAIAEAQEKITNIIKDQLNLLVIMPLTEFLPTVRQLTHEDKLQLIHFLLLAVAKEEGCNLEATKVNPEQNLLNQLASTDAVVWSPQADDQAVTALSNLWTQSYK